MKKPPKKRPGDKVFAVVKAAASVVPVGGSAVAAVMGLVGPEIEKRREKWFELLAGAVSELEEKARNFANNPMFVTAVLEATNIAIRSHQAEKLSALRNAVRNSVLPQSPNDSVQLMFLRFVDEFTALHLRILAILDDPQTAVASSTNPRALAGGGLPFLFYHCIPEINGQGTLVEQLYRDLQNRGLITQGSNIHALMTDTGLLAKRTTDLGERFLRFIR